MPLDAPKRDIPRAVNGSRAELIECDSLLIYYAGHGWLNHQTGSGYWQPVDFEDEGELNWVANGGLTRRFNAMTARHFMVIVDSCYSGTPVREATSRLPTGAERKAWLRRMAETRSPPPPVTGGQRTDPVPQGEVAAPHSVVPCPAGVRLVALAFETASNERCRLRGTQVTSQ